MAVSGGSRRKATRAISQASMVAGLVPSVVPGVMIACGLQREKASTQPRLGDAGANGGARETAGFDKLGQQHEITVRRHLPLFQYRD